MANSLQESSVNYATLWYSAASLKCNWKTIAIMTRRITIAGVIFNVEPLGYEILRAYKDAWNKRNPHNQRQWEELTAEYLLQELTKGERITTLDHVEGISQVLPEVPLRSSHLKTEGGKGKYFFQLAFGLW